MESMKALATASLLASLLVAACGKQEQAAKPAAPPPPPPVAHVAIGAEDCRIGIEVSPQGPYTVARGALSVLPLTLTVTNKGRATWGPGGPDIHVGAVWFAADKTGAGHDPNFGEVRWPLPTPLPAGGTVKFDVNLPVSVAPRDYQVWLSGVQAGVMWCFHVGDPPAKLLVSVKSPEGTKGK